MYFATFWTFLWLSLFKFAWICVLTDTCRSFFKRYFESTKKCGAKIGLPSERNHRFRVEFEVRAPAMPPLSPTPLRSPPGTAKHRANALEAPREPSEVARWVEWTGVEWNICVSVYRCIGVSVYLSSVYQCICVSVHLCICVTVYLYICVSM